MSDVHVMHQVTTTRHTSALRAGDTLVGSFNQPLGIVREVRSRFSEPTSYVVTLYLFRSHRVEERVCDAHEPWEVFWHADIEK